MKVLCSHCDRLFEVASFRLEAGALVIPCAACGAELRTAEVKASAAAASGGAEASPRPSSPSQSRPVLVSAADASNVVSLRTASTVAVEHARAQSDSAELFLVPKAFCPKCLDPRVDGAEACARCGVVFALAPREHLEVADWLARAWRELLKSWGDEARHERLRREAALRDALIDLARLYRLRLALVPEDPFAQRGREALLRAATMSITRASSADLEQRSRKGSSFTVVAAATGVAVLLLGLLVVLVRMLGRE